MPETKFVETEALLAALHEDRGAVMAELDKMNQTEALEFREALFWLADLVAQRIEELREDLGLESHTDALFCGRVAEGVR